MNRIGVTLPGVMVDGVSIGEVLSMTFKASGQDIVIYSMEWHVAQGDAVSVAYSAFEWRAYDTLAPFPRERRRDRAQWKDEQTRYGRKR